MGVGAAGAAAADFVAMAVACGAVAVTCGAVAAPCGAVAVTCGVAAVSPRTVVDSGVVHVVYGCHVHFGAQALGSGDVGDMQRLLREQTGGRFRTGIFHDARGGRPEFTERMRGHLARVQRRPAGRSHDE